AGSLDDPPDKHGLASFTIDVMERGSTRRTFAQLYEEVEGIGASFGLNSGSHTMYFGAKSLSEHMPHLLDILQDVLRNPSFNPEHVEKTRAEILADIQERSNSTHRMASLEFYQLAYPENHPYHWSQLGYESSINRITREDLIHFHQTHISPRNSVLVMVGDVDGHQAVDMVSKLFSDWHHTPVQRPDLPVVPRLERRLEKSILIEDKVQSDVILGWPGPARAHPEFLPCFLGNTVLGVFGMYGRLGQAVREQNGLAYYAYSSISGGLGPGPWRINTGVEPGNVLRVVDILRDEIRHILEHPVPEDELEDSRAFLIGSLPMHLETNEGLTQAIINIERHQMKLDYLREYTEMIRGISATEVQTALQHWLHPDQFALSIAGPEFGRTIL
ncbi:MAG: pitrilysin family protein, partial [Anaerolineae bacterium]|nr:pitrilysin family protein [Anaerolineae bacterium]